MTLRLILRNITPDAPAAVKNVPPSPGKRSTLWTSVPIGKEPRGKESPSLAKSVRININNEILKIFPLMEFSRMNTDRLLGEYTAKFE